MGDLGSNIGSRANPNLNSPVSVWHRETTEMIRMEMMVDESRRFVVVDPDENPLREERFWGVYESLEAAQSEVPKLRCERGVDDGQGGIGDSSTGLEEWIGGELVAAWEFHPIRASCWRQIYPSRESS